MKERKMGGENPNSEDTAEKHEMREAVEHTATKLMWWEELQEEIKYPNHSTEFHTWGLDKQHFYNHKSHSVDKQRWRSV